MPSRKRVAVIGSGSAGLGAAYALRNTDYEVHIFEKDARLGGHTNTCQWTAPTNPGMTTPVDTGFIILNTATYPNFINFLKDVDVPTTKTEMTFSVARKYPNFEWSGSLHGVFAQRRNLFRPRHWRLLFDIIRFNQYAPDMLSDKHHSAKKLTIGEYLDREGYSEAFKDDYLIPMTAAVWSTAPDKASLKFPAQTLLRFMWNHHLVTTLAARPDWLTIPGGAQRYIDAIVQSYPAQRLHIHLSSEVTSLVRNSSESQSPVKLYWRSAEATAPEEDAILTKNDTFEHVIMACHGDQVWPILEGSQPSKRRDSKARSESSNSSQAGSSQVSGSEEGESTNDPRILTGEDAWKREIDIFKHFETTENVCYLHSDISLMPKRRKTWSSWNYLISSISPSELSSPAGVSLTYNMNHLQHIPREAFGDVLVTMNPEHAPKTDLIQGKYVYRHPLYTVEAIRAQERLQTVQNSRGVSFCGAWTKYGFHEDGFSSGLKVAIDHLGATVPFEFKDSTYARGEQRPALTPGDLALRAALMFILSWIRLGEYLLGLPGVSLLVFAVSWVVTINLDVLEWSGLLT